MEDSSRLSDSVDADDHAVHLIALIDSYLNGSCSFSEFNSEYYNYYTDVMPEWALTDQERSLFFAIQEKLDWVDARPDNLSRQDGWIDVAEFREWLESLRPRVGNSNQSNTSGTV